MIAWKQCEEGFLADIFVLHTSQITYKYACIARHSNPNPDTLVLYFHCKAIHSLLVTPFLVFQELYNAFLFTCLFVFH
jgi:hypothetical protein